jgi:hypothetical protein
MSKIPAKFFGRLTRNAVRRSRTFHDHGLNETGLPRGKGFFEDLFNLTAAGHKQPVAYSH